MVWRGLTNAGRRHGRQRRLQAYQAFSRKYGWPVLGLHQDLSRYLPVAPLMGATSAQTELALSGHWRQRRAVVASVLVQSREAPGHPHPDTVVQLTALRGGAGLQFTATWHENGPELSLLSKPEPGRESLRRLEEALRAAGAFGVLCAGDHLADNGRELLHSRTLGTLRRPDIHAPLDALARLAVALE